MTQDQTRKPAQRSLWNRTVPVRVRHNIRLIAGSIVALALVAIMLGSFQIRPIVFSQTEMLPTITNNVAGTVDLFDLSIPHSFSLEVSDIAYAHMISEFQLFEEKAFVEADLTIDGTLLRSVAIRLKGNSTLFGISGRGPGGGGSSGPPPGPSAGSAGEIPTDAPPVPTEGLANGATAPPPGPPPSDAPSGPGPGGVMAKVMRLIAGATEEDPSTLPLLISFDELMPGRGYQGRTELSLRPAAGGGASLNEALGLQLIEDSGQVSQRYTWVTFSVNGEKTRTRLVLENPNQNYASAMAASGMGRGVLYKSRNSNDFEYKGEDPTLYVEDFLQLSAIGSRDIAPVIRLLAWVESATDEEFDAQLPQWIDVHTFAQYVVTQDLLDNFDDMAGPGRNFMLWYDLDDKKFSVINWDMNLVLVGVGSAFKAPPAAAPDAELSVADDSDDSDDGESASPAAPSTTPSGLKLGNTLKDRFVASELYSIEIERTREDMLELWFTSGHALELLGELSNFVPVTDHLSQEEIDSQIASLTETILATE